MTTPRFNVHDRVRAVDKPIEGTVKVRSWDSATGACAYGVRPDCNKGLTLWFKERELTHVE